jgi:hypothetical protein
VFNSTYSYPLPPEIASAPKARFRFRGTDGNNWIGGWGLRTTNEVPFITFPQLQPILDQEITAGQLLLVSTTTLNPYAPPDRHEFRMLEGPEGAWVDRRTGVFYWQPTIWQSPASARVKLQVRDTGTPAMTSVQEFAIDVVRPTGPALQTAGEADTFRLQVTAAIGTYHVFSSTNGIDWSPLASTNLSETTFEIQEPTLSRSQRFYRVSHEPGVPELELPLPAPGQNSYTFRVQVKPGHFQVEASDDMVQWQTFYATNMPPFYYEVRHPVASGEPPTTYRILGGTASP